MASNIVKVKYNPFTVTTEFELNGEHTKSGRLIELSNNLRLQNWIDRLFDLLFEELNTQKINLIFEGMILDGEDVKSAVKAYQERETECSLSVDCRVFDVQTDKKIEQLKELFEEAKKGPFEIFYDKSLHDAFEKAISPEFDVTVLATMSAGKSTVINAMVGRELLPSKNQACTASITRVINDDSKPNFEARRSCKVAQDSEEVKLSDDWQELEDCSPLIRDWNEEKFPQKEGDSENNREEKYVTSQIEIKGNIPTIHVRDGIQMVFVDTPGPNNSNDLSHNKTTVQAIQGHQPSMVLYVLNATNLGVEDDLSLLNLIRDEMAKGGRKAQDRFVFIANKIDQFDPENDDEPIAKVLENVKAYLQKNGIENPLIIPVSAELCKLIRIAREGAQLTRKQQNSLDNLTEQFVEEEGMNLLELIAPELGTQLYDRLKQQLDSYREEKNDEKVSELLSGIPIVEALLDDYLSKHALPAKIKDAVDIFRRAEQEHQALEAIQKILEKDQAALETITSTLEAFQKDQTRIDKAQQFRNAVEVKKYSSSGATKYLLDNLEKKINTELLDPLSKEFKGEIDLLVAEKKIKKAEEQILLIVAEIQNLLAEDLERVQKEELMVLRDDYQKYVADLLSALPDTEESKLIKDFQEAQLDMPSVDTLVEKMSVEVSEIVKAGTERYGFLWLWKRDVYEIKTEKKVDMVLIYQTFENAMAKFKQKSFDEFDSRCAENFEQSKDVLLAHMEALDKKLEELVEQMAVAKKDATKKKKLVADSQKRLDWFKSFFQRLDAILQLNPKLGETR